MSNESAVNSFQTIAPYLTELQLEKTFKIIADQMEDRGIVFFCYDANYGHYTLIDVSSDESNINCPACQNNI